MPRRFLTRHIRPRPLDEREIKQYLRVYDARSLYHHPESFPRLCSQHLFGNSAPLELEVGCGTAEFLCSLASREPGVNFIGVDIARRPLYKAVAVTSSLQLTNVCFIHANFTQMYPLLESCVLRQVYVHFPDPNMHPKFRRRKLVTPAFLDAIHQALIAEGGLSLITDHSVFFQELLAVVEADSRFQKNHPERYLMGFEPERKSRFQLIWERHDLPILRLEVRKKQS